MSFLLHLSGMLQPAVEVSQSIVLCPQKCSMFTFQMNSQYAMLY